MPYRIEISAYDQRWPGWFEAERARFAAALGDLHVRTEHIGSTAVVGLAAKPIIDLMVGVAEAGLLDVSAEAPFRASSSAPIVPAGTAGHVALVTGLAELGYVYRGDAGIASRLYFRRDTIGHGATAPTRTHHAHVCLMGGAFWESHILFRDYLSAHPAEAAQYVALKRALAARFPDDRAAYTDGKSDFIASALAHARRQH